MQRFCFIFIILAVTVSASSYKDQLAEFQAYKQQQTTTFQVYKKEQNKVFQAYKHELMRYWEQPKLSTKTQWIHYSQDQKTRSDVDFKNNYITVETVANTPKQAKHNLQLALAKTVTFNTKQAYKYDTLQQRLDKISQPTSMVRAQLDTKPILAPILFKHQSTKKDVVSFVQTHTKHIGVKQQKNTHKKIYFVTINLPKDSVIQRSKIYYKEVVSNANKQSLPIPLVFAIIHSESSFNPMARSYIPAYGLMQIVPRTAGIDAYKFLYGKKKLLSAQYLYNAHNNITVGSAYLHILYYNYLRSIKNPTSRLYCTIAAYNTGAGNVARAFVGTNSTQKAAKVINKLKPDEVYAKLMKDLRYDEPKQYLKRVTKRMHLYAKIYVN